ncbi:MAG: Ig domain-containing protein, partial [Clostridia bacterium]|nr:Ig domain-containing protein [Clostridia bacterium]
MKHMRIISVTLIIAMLLSMAGLAEAPAEMEQYVAEAADTELIEYAVPASEYLLSAGAPSVTLTGSKASAAMDVEESLQIAVNAGETGVFTSKNPKLASVDGDGLVTALAKGTAKIEFKPDGGKKRTLTIKISDPYEPTGVKFDQGKAATVDVGDDLQLDAVLAPETARTVLTWKSSKPKVADVDQDGLVTALTEGKATITATTANKKKATITVTVKDPYKPTGVSLDQGKAATVDVGDDLQLDAVLAPETARTVLTWKSSKPKAADVDAD